MDVTRSAQAAAPGAAVHRSSGYGLPCAKCRLYYPANVDICPTCNHKERTPPNVIPVAPNSPVACTLGEHHVEGAEAASVCKPCYERLQERVDVCEAALHIELKD